MLRFAFVSGPTVYGGSGGNAITGVRFSQAHGFVVDLDHVTTDDAAAGQDDAKINEGYDYSITLTPDNGYRLPDELAVKIGSNEYTVPTDGSADLDGITFNPDTGLLNIPGDLINGDVTITAEAVTIVTQVLTGLDTTNEENVLDDDEGSFTTDLPPKEGYGMPETIEVKIGDDTYKIKTDGTSSTPDGVTFNPVTGTLTIDDAASKDKIIITAVGVPLLTQELTNINTTNPDNKVTDDGFSTNLTPKPGYRLPDTIEVELGGTKYTIRTDETLPAPNGITF